MKGFANFFSAYTGTAVVVVSAATFPLTYFGVVPVLEYQRGILSVYSSLFTFFVVAIVFYRRDRIASYMFPELWKKKSRVVGRFIMSWMPVICLFVAFAASVSYYILLMDLVSSSSQRNEPIEIALKKILVQDVAESSQVKLVVLYLLMFISTSAGLSIMAMKEFMISKLAISEKVLVESVEDPFAGKESGGV